VSGNFFIFQFLVVLNKIRNFTPKHHHNVYSSTFILALRKCLILEVVQCCTIEAYRFFLFKKTKTIPIDGRKSFLNLKLLLFSTPNSHEERKHILFKKKHVLSMRILILMLRFLPSNNQSV
jgi:hypothetical protein